MRKGRRGRPLGWLTGQSYGRDAMVAACRRRVMTSLEAESLSIRGSLRVGGATKLEAKTMAEEAVRRSQEERRERDMEFLIDSWRARVGLSVLHQQSN